MVQRRVIAVFLLLVTVPTPACSQCTTCNQQPSQVYYNSQVAVQPANNGRPAGYVNIQFQPPSSVSRNQQIYVWYGNPQPVQNQLNQALNIPQNNNGVQPQYNPNGYNNNNNQQPVMYNNINRDQPNYANQPQPYNPNVPQQTPRPNQPIPGFLPPAGVPSTAFPYSTTTPAYNTVGPLAPINQAFDQPPTYLNTGSTSTPAPPYYGSTTAAPPVTTTHVPSSTSASQFVFTSSSTPSSPSSSTLAVPSPYLAEGFTPTSSPPPPNTNDPPVLAPLPAVFPSFPASPVSSSSVNVVPLSPASQPSSNTVIITQSYSGPATAQTGLGQAPSSFSQTIVSPNEASRISLDQTPGQASISQTVASPNQASQTRIDQNQTQTTLTRTAISANQTLSGANLIPSGTVTQTVIGGNQVPTSGSQPSSTTTFTFVGTNQGTDAAFASNQGVLGSNQPTGTADSQFGTGQLPVTSQSGSSVTPLPVIFPSPSASNQVASGSNFGQSSGPAFQPNPSASGAQSATAFVQDSGSAIPPPVGSQPSFQPNPSAEQQFQPSSSQVQQQPYNPALVTSQTAPVSNQYDATFAPQPQQQQQGSAAAAAVGGGSAAVAAAALAAAAAAGSNSTRASTTPFPYSTQFAQGTAMPTIQPAPSASQIPLATSTSGSMQPTTSTLAYSPSPSPSPIPTSTLASSSPSSTTRVPSSTTPFPSSSPSTTQQQPLQQQQQVLQPSQQLQQQPLSGTAQPSTTISAQVYSPSTTAFPYSTQFNQGTPMPTGTVTPYYSSTMSPSTTPFYPSTTTMAPPTSTFPPTTTAPMYTTSPSTVQQPQYGNTLQPSQQLQQQPYVQQQLQQPSTFAPYSSTQGPTTTAPVQIGYNPAGQPVYGQPTSTQAPFVSTTPTTPYAQSTTPYGSQYPMTGTPVNQGAIGVNNMNNAPGSTPYYPSTTPSPQQPFYSPSTTQQPFVQGPTTTAPGVYQIGQGVPGVPNTANPQFNPPQNVQSSTYSPYAAGGSTLGTQQMYDPSTGLVTANGMNTMYGRYTTMEPGSQMMRDVPINGGATLSLAAGMAALLFLF